MARRPPGRPPGKSKKKCRIRTAAGRFGKRLAPSPPADPLVQDDDDVQDDDEPQLHDMRGQEDKGDEKDDSSRSKHSSGTPEDVMCDGTTRGQARRRNKARRGEEHQQGPRAPRCVDERSDDEESGAALLRVAKAIRATTACMSSHDSDFELTNDEEDKEVPQDEEGPQPLGGARESLPPRGAAAADHQNSPAALLRRSPRVLPIATYAPLQRARPKGTHPGPGRGRGKTQESSWTRAIRTGPKKARREARLETSEQRGKGLSAEKERAARSGGGPA